MNWAKVGLALAAIATIGAQSTESDWSADEVKTLRSLWIESLETVRPSPSNFFADNPAAAALGRALFSDTRLSSNAQVSCASCHQSANGFTDALPTASGVGTGTRRTMPIAQAVHSPWQFWDGRADSLWSQALGPIENPLEHDFTRTEVARVLGSHYRNAYEQLFGPLPDLTDHRRFPLRAGPNGDERARAAWAGMTLEDKRIVDRIYANFGKSIEAFERTLKLGPTRFDHYIAGLVGAGPAIKLSPSARSGLRLFIGKGRCVTCHNGPMLSNGGFANTGVPPRAGLPEDSGRIAGARAALADPFNCRGVYSDAGGNGCEELDFMVADDPGQVRAYKVASLRGVGRRAPYMHAGQLPSLAKVIDHYDRAPRAVRGVSELKPLHLTARERLDLVSFLLTLDEGPQATNDHDGGSFER